MNEKQVRAYQPVKQLVQERGECQLSYGQYALWLQHQLDPQSSSYHVHIAFRIHTPVDCQAMHTALADLVQRHAILRTTFTMQQGQPVQQIHADVQATPLEIVTLPDWQPEHIAACLTEARLRPFDLEQHYPFRALLLISAQAQHESIFLFVIHHIVADAWTLNLLMRDFFQLYEAALKQESAQLAEIPAHYADFVQWQQALLASEQGAQLRAYWRRQLKGDMTLFNPPFTFPPTSERTHTGATFVFILDEELTRAIRELAWHEGTTLYTVLLASFMLLLHCYDPQEHVQVGSPMIGRSRAEFEHIAGYFTNLVVLRADMSVQATFQQFLAQVFQVVLDAMEHQDYPFAALLDAIQPELQSARLPLVNVAFALESLSLFKAGFSPFVLGAEGFHLHLGGLDLEPCAFQPQQEGIFDLALLLYEHEQHLQGLFQYDINRFTEETIARMVQHFLVLLKRLVRAPELRLADISLMLPEEQTLLVDTWNQTESNYRRDLCVHELFELQVIRIPCAPAVVCGTERLTYQELNRSANQLAHALRARGVGPDVLVGICCERLTQLLIGLLAILKAGGAYVPLDPAYPQERLSLMIQDTRLSLILTLADLQDCLPPDHPPLFLLDRDWSQVAQQSIHNPEHWSQPCNLAYVIYTSGSSGQPRGVAVTHQNILRLVNNATYAQFGYGQCFLHLAPISFDAATFEVWGALLNGMKCVLFPERYPTPAQIQAQIKEHQVTTMWLTAALFNTLFDENPATFAGLHQLLVGGEALSVPHIRRALTSPAFGVQLINGYGPTECTTFACCHTILRGTVDETTRSIPLGRPIQATQVYILNEQLQPVPIGVPGELYIGGDGLARGYLGQPALTAERFIPHPWGQEPGARLYKTGDQVRYLPDGTIEFLGRLDQQVKIRGYRIEPGEIEAALQRHPGVKNCLVQVRATEAQQPCLVAYVVLSSSPIPDEHLTAQQYSVLLREYLQGCLPAYMLPASFVLMDTFPLSPVGKIDYKALPPPIFAASGMVTDDDPARTPVEELVATIWRQVLRREQVGLHENFFASGGHSLLATQIVARIERVFHLSFPIQRFFQQPTIAELARQIEHLRLLDGGSLPLPLHARVQHEELAPLSFAQQRLWFLDQLVPESPLYNIPLAWHLAGPLDVQVLEQSLSALLQRHESLRTAFVQHKGYPRQRIEAVPTIVLSLLDMSHLPREALEQCWQQEALREAQLPFDLRTGQLLRARLLRLSAREHIFLLTVHHIACDGWSLHILYQELYALYAAFVAGQSSPLPALPIQYADFACWQHAWKQQGGLEEHLAYWRQQLANPPLLELPTDFPRPVIETFRGARVPLLFEPTLLHDLKVLSRRQEVTLFMTLLAAFQTLLMRYSGQDDIVVGVPIAHRTHLPLEELIGMFVNILVMRTDFSQYARCEDLLQGVRRITLDAYAHQDAPFERLVEELCPQRTREHNPLCQVSFQFLATPQEALRLPDLTVRSLDIYNATAKVDIQVTCWESPQGLCGFVEYNADLFRQESMQRLVGHFQQILRAFSAHPAQRLSDLCYLTVEEQTLLIATWNQTQRPYPEELCVHELFERHAAQTPDAIALVSEQGQLSYHELNRRANQLASALRERGVGPEVLVGICDERSPAFLIALFGILKAGGGYVPLDPAYPTERLALMIRGTSLSLILTETHLQGCLPDVAPPCLLLDRDWSEIARQSEENPERWATPSNLVYVIYTSGSSGQPKGVAIAHRGLLNVVTEEVRQFQITRRSRVLQWASLSFDASVWDIVMALLSGATLYLPPPALTLIGADLGAYLAEQAIEVISLTPSALATLPQPLPDLQAVIVGAESCPLDVMRTWATGRRFYNVYGPTEMTIWASTAMCDASLEKMHIGKPIANAQIYILDAQLLPVPIGIPGELYMSGDGLARGYFGQPALTAERFIPHLWSAEPGARLYKTGDWGRYLPDGSIEFLGRRDQQVKLRGYRIELGEIEAVLNHHPALHACLVQARTMAAHDLRLVAYLVTDFPAPSRKELSAYLKQHLPVYMLPSYIVFLDAFPLLPNRKVDTRALPPPVESDYVQMHGHEPPQTETELLLADIWKQVLDMPEREIGRHDTFFDLGGHSLLVAHLVTELQEQFDLTLPLATVMEHSTIAALALVIEQQRDACLIDAGVAVRHGEGI